MVEFQYNPRPQFVDFHQRHQRNALMVCHRRMGKTVSCIGDLVVRALHTTKKDARYGYIAPFRLQAKEIAWMYLKNMTQGIRIEAPRESELRVKLPNGAWITIYGADNPDAIRGLYFDGLILDEFGDMKPSLLAEVIVPCLSDRQGFLVLIGTMKGRGVFYDYSIKARDSGGEWFYKMAKASETKIIPQDELDRMRLVMGDAKYEQEMECNPDAAIEGAYYADIINSLKQSGHMVTDELLYSSGEKVYVSADVGLRDTTAWWFWQPRPDGYAIIDHYEASGVHIDHYLGMLHGKGYDYAEIHMPHDARAKTLATKRSTIEQFASPHEVRPDIYPPGSRLPIRVVPKLAIQHGIDAARLILPHCWFDMTNCYHGVDALAMYRREYHEHTRSFSDTPKHDWASNSADAFRYMALVAQKTHGVVSDKPVQPVRKGPTLDELWADNKRSSARVIRL